MIKPRHIHFVLLLIATAGIGACGQMGPLYLPEPAEQAEPAEDEQDEKATRQDSQP